jgi:cell division septum initiation protein DivIVA
MAADNPTEALSILSDAPRGFDTAMRGYDRRQVDVMLARLEDDVRAASAERDASAARTADLAAQLASAHAQIESLRRQLRSATEQVDHDNVDARVRALLDAATVDAGRIRAEAEAYQQQVRVASDDAAERVKANARTESEQMLEAAKRRQVEADDTFRRRIAEADRYRSEITDRTEREVALAREQEAQLTREASVERDRLDAEALAVRTGLDAESLARRTALEEEVHARIAVAEEDFEITLRRRRTAEAERSEQQLAQAQATAQRLIDEAGAESARRVQAASDTVAALRGQRDRVQADLTVLHDALAALIADAASRRADDAGSADAGLPTDEAPADAHPGDGG